MKPMNASFAGVLVRHREYPSNGTNDVLTYSYPSSSHRVECSSIIKGNFKSPLPWSFSVGHNENGPLTDCFYQQANGNKDTWSGNYVGATEGLATWIASDMAAADAEAYAQLTENIRGGTDLSIDAFQMRQTIGTPRQMLDMARKARKIKKLVGAKRLTRPMKLSGNAWLLWTYGIKPTMQSIHDTITFQRKHYMDTVKVFTGKGVVVTERDIAVPNWPDDGGWTSVSKVRTSVRVLYKVRMKIPDTTLTSAARLSSLNPASIAWELLPWSFVVDWFLNIGDYLRGLETSIIYERYFTDGFKTTSLVSSGDQTANRTGTPPAGVTWAGKYRATSVVKSMNRVLLSSYPTPPVPKLRSNLGSGRMLNAAALLTTFLR